MEVCFLLFAFGNRLFNDKGKETTFMEYKIYQLVEGCDNRFEKSFAGLDELAAKGIEPRLTDYDEVWAAEWVGWSGGKEALAEKLFAVFNTNRPAGFAGHSMSVGDVVWIGDDYLYCDPLGFRPLPVGFAEK